MISPTVKVAYCFRTACSLRNFFVRINVGEPRQSVNQICETIAGLEVAHGNNSHKQTSAEAEKYEEHLVAIMGDDLKLGIDKTVTEAFGYS